MTFRVWFEGIRVPPRWGCSERKRGPPENPHTSSPKKADVAHLPVRPRSSRVQGGARNRRSGQFLLGHETPIWQRPRTRFHPESCLSYPTRSQPQHPRATSRGGRLLHAPRGERTGPIMGISPGGGVQTGTVLRSGARGRTSQFRDGARLGTYPSGQSGTPGRERRSPTGIARERETSADDKAFCQLEFRTLFQSRMPRPLTAPPNPGPRLLHARRGLREDPTMRVSPGPRNAHDAAHVRDPRSDDHGDVL